MRLILFQLIFIVTIFSSCNDKSQTSDHKGLLKGNWLILYPDHENATRKEREIYGKYQDSIIKLYGLKLVSFDSNGYFRELDSLNTTGKWTFSKDSTVEIRNGGKGFTAFYTKWEQFENDTLELREFVPLENKHIKLVWHLKKINKENDGNRLFQTGLNKWRIKPSEPETDEEIRKRLSEMLKFYSAYFYMLEKESAYFIPARVCLPFKYYRHAIRIKEPTEQFRNCFYNEEQAIKAGTMLDSLNKKLDPDFPTEENYVKEYASFMEIMARVILLED